MSALSQSWPRCSDVMIGLQAHSARSCSSVPWPGSSLCRRHTAVLPARYKIFAEQGRPGRGSRPSSVAPKAVPNTADAPPAAWLQPELLPRTSPGAPATSTDTAPLDSVPLEEAARQLLRGLDKGDISVSAYDTAWLARIPAEDGSPGPMFPQALEWVVDNQLPDGSWGETSQLLYHDRILSTLSAIVALATWAVASESVSRGAAFVVAHLGELAQEERATATVGFELLFPALLQTAKELGVALPYGHSVVHQVQQLREEKLARLPLQVVYSRATTVLHSLEGLAGLVDCQRVLHLQARNGSFLNSPAATSFAYLSTRDPKCLDYLKDVSSKFGGAAPVNYPIDLFERLWVVDRIKRLGLGDLLAAEVDAILADVAAHWSERGMCWSRDIDLPDLDDTAVAFRLLRGHGYDVSPGAFETFSRGDVFQCFEGQMEGAVSHVINLFHASQVRTEREDVLKHAEDYALKFLNERVASTPPGAPLLDKWVISPTLRRQAASCLSGARARLTTFVRDTELALEVAEADDVWVDKVLYRLPLLNNRVWPLLARQELNRLKERSALEVRELTMWANDLSPTFSASSKKYLAQMAPPLIYLYANIAPSAEDRPLRLAWSKVAMLQFMLDGPYDSTTAAMSDLESATWLVREWARQEGAGGADLVAVAVAEGGLVDREMGACAAALMTAVEEAAWEATQKQGWNTAPYLAKQLAEIYDATLEESKAARAPSEDGATSLEAYLDRARLTMITNFYVALLLLDGAGMQAPPLAVHHPQYYRIRNMVATGIRLANDLQTYEKERAEGTAATGNAIGVLMRHKGYEEARARREVCQLAMETLEGLQRELQKYVPSEDCPAPALPKRFTETAFVFTRTVMDFYLSDSDFYAESSSPKLQKVNDFFRPF